MGGSSSKDNEVIVREVESDESKRVQLLRKLESQLQQLRQEVEQVKPTIKDNVKENVCLEQDALLIRYSQLQDTSTIEKNIREIFGKFPAHQFLVDTANRMIAALNHTDELKEIMRWHEKKVIKRIKGRVYGLELHYKLILLEEDKGRFRSHKETVVMIGYKVLAHTMNLNPEEYPDDEELEALTF